MSDSLVLIDIFARGVAVGATSVLGLSIVRGGENRSARVAGALMCVSIIAWLVSESLGLWTAMGQWLPLVIAAFPVGGLFWLFVVGLFEDRPLAAPALAVPVALTGVGLLILILEGKASNWAWLAYNGVSGALALHALFAIARGWSGDLVEGRRRLRGAVLGLGAVFALVSVTMGLMSRLDPAGPWRLFLVGNLYGGLAFATLMVAGSTVFLQTPSAVFGATRRAVPAADGRAEAAERVLLGKLNDFMAADGWRQEGLTIGAVARALGEPEHRVRRLINQRLGHRNFADFVNGYRIEAAKRRLADPVEARTTVATIAFDLGYGSLGPFNRAFRAATGETPTGWRRAALADSPQLKEAD